MIGDARSPRVLVLLATFDGARWLRTQLDSIGAQHGVGVDIVVSDDGSNDATPDLLRDAERLGQLRVLPEWAGARSSAGNFFRLIAAVDPDRYDFVALADQDDFWHADKLFLACRHLRASGAAGYSSAVRARWANGRTAILAQSPAITTSDFLFEGAGQGCTFVLTRAAFQAIQAFVRQQPAAVATLAFHDWFIYAFIRAGDGRWFFDPEPSVDYRQHAENVIGARGGRGSIMKRLARIRSGWYARQVRAMTSALSIAYPARPLPLNDWPTGPMGTKSALSIRRLVLMATCSRRRRIDRAILVLATLLGWL